MNRYNAAEQAQADPERMTHARFLRRFSLIGPDANKAQSAKSEVLMRLKQGSEEFDPIIVRTKTGKNFWAPEGMGRVLGIEPVERTDSKVGDGRELIAVHDMLQGVVEVVQAAAHTDPESLDDPDRIIAAGIIEKLAQLQRPAAMGEVPAMAEVVELPRPAEPPQAQAS